VPAPQVLRVVVASPSDVRSERASLDRVVAEVNDGVARDRDLRLELVKWEKDAFPGFHPAGPQGLIDTVLRIEDCDLFIGIFWRRFGTATAEAASGTEHEFLRAYEAWQATRRPHILFYFKNKAFTQRTSEEINQLQQVVAFKERFPAEGLYWEFRTAAEFEQLVRGHLTKLVRARSAAPFETREGAQPAGDAQRAPDSVPEPINYSGLDFESILSSPPGDELFSVAFSPDGTVAAGSNEVIFLWDRERPSEPNVFEHDSYVYSVAFSPDGRWLASGGEDGTVRVYDVASGELRWKPREHREAVYSVAFSRDGELLASGGYDRVVNLWNARTGRRQNNLTGAGRVTSVAFSPIEMLLAIGDLNDAVTLWKFDRNDSSELEGHTSSVETVAFSPDGKLLASGGLDKLVRVWDVAARRHAWPQPGRGHEYLIRSLAFSPDGRTLASASWDKTLRLWEVDTGRCRDELPWDELKQDHRWHSDWIWSVAFSQNGMLVASGGSDGKIVLLSVSEAIAGVAAAGR
jgi:hypothetical protein